MREFAKLQRSTLDGLGRRVIAALLFAVALTWLGALRTESHDVFSRMGYWTINLVAWAVLSTLGLRLMRPLMPASLSSRWQIIVITTALTSIPMVALTSMITSAISQWTASPLELLEMFPSIWLIGGAQLVLCEALEPAPARSVDRRAVEGQTERQPSFIDPETENATGLIARLPRHLGTDIICLRVEDHYVRVHTNSGSALILTRFADALRDVAAIPGMRVHRSWWVAHSTVDTISRVGRTGELHMHNGVVVPISQPYLADALKRWADRLVSAA